ncbi:MAG TPA: vitamin K epoxide reductase family protein [Phycisphaerae bacterium]|nr:vitamin K epoxide reductase family protein [Phycisphaerae bacterium]
MTGVRSRAMCRWVCVAAALAGMVGSMELTAIHLRGPQTATGWVDLLCGAGPESGCQQVLASPWSMFGGLPVAAFSSGYFALLAVWYLLVGLTDYQHRWWQSWALLVNVAGCFISIQFIWIMFTRLPTWCPLCLFCHVCNFVVLLGAWLIWPGPTSVQPTARIAAKSKLAMAVILAGLCLFLLFVGATRLSILAAQGMRFRDAFLSVASDSDYIQWRWQNEPQLAVPVRPADPVRGPGDARHQAVVFSDFQCPQCAALAGVLDALIEQFPGDIQVVFKYLPLDRTCNDRIRPVQSIYPSGCQAARAAEAARVLAGKDGFWKLHDAMMRNQGLIGIGDFAQLARLAGLPPESLQAEMASDRVARRIAQSIADAPALPMPGSDETVLPGTPLLILDGRRLERWAVFQVGGGRPTVDMSRTVNLWGRLLGLPVTQPSSP